MKKSKIQWHTVRTLISGNISALEDMAKMRVCFCPQAQRKPARIRSSTVCETSD